MLLTALILVHLLVAAAWFGAHLAIRAAACCGSGSLENARLVRFLLLRVEMPLAALAPLLGIVLSVLRPEVWSQGWFHAKLTAFAALYGLLVSDSLRSKRRLAALEAGENPQRTGFAVAWAFGSLAFAAVFFCAKVRFGISP